MEKNQSIRLLSEAPVGRALVRLGIPTMVGMLVSSLYNLVDTYFVGWLGTAPQAAVAAVFPLGLVLLGMGLLFGSGAGSYLSRLLGKGEQQKADECASTAAALAVASGVLLVAIMLLFLNPILRLLGCTGTMMPYARQYAVLFIPGLAVNVFNATMSNLATAEGKPVYSMCSMLLGGAVNTALDPIMISAMGMGVSGAALATLIARFVSLGCYMRFIFRKKSGIRFSVKNIHATKMLLREIAVIGVPACLYQVLCSTALSVMNNLAAPYGDAAIAAIGIVSRVITLVSMTVMGFLKGYQTFVGFNCGAKNYGRVRAATRTAVLWTTCFCAVCCALMLLFHTPLIHAFNQSDPRVLSIGTRALLLSSFTVLTYGFQVTYATKFMGLGKGAEGGLVSLGRQGLFFIPAVYVLTVLWHLDGLILAQPAADLLSMALVCALAVKNRREETLLIAAAEAEL